MAVEAPKVTPADIMRAAEASRAKNLPDIPDAAESRKIKNPKQWMLLDDLSISLPGTGPMRMRRGDIVYDPIVARLLDAAGVKIRAVA